VIRQGLRRVAAQRQDVFDLGFRVSVEDRREFRLTMADTREVRDCGQPGLPLNPDDQVMCALARRAAGAVGYRHERGLESLQMRNGLKQIVRSFVGLGREELKAERGGPSLENVLDVHGCSRNSSQ